MILFPSSSEVLVSSLSKKEVLARLDRVTRNVNFLDIESRKANGFKFNGQIFEDRFRISLFIDKADSFLPLIKGKIESTPSGSILFLEYSLFPGSVFFLGFWTAVSVLLGMVFGFLVGKPVFALVSIALGIGNYWFTWSHFKRKIKISQGIFLSLLNN